MDEADLRARHGDLGRRIPDERVEVQHADLAHRHRRLVVQFVGQAIRGDVEVGLEDARLRERPDADDLMLPVGEAGQLRAWIHEAVHLGLSR